MANSERAANDVSEPCSILGRTCSLPDCDRPCDGESRHQGLVRQAAEVLQGAFLREKARADRYHQALMTLSRYDDSLRASNWPGLANIVKEALSDQ